MNSYSTMVRLLCVLACFIGGSHSAERIQYTLSHKKVTVLHLTGNCNRSQLLVHDPLFRASNAIANLLPFCQHCLRAELPLHRYY